MSVLEDKSRGHAWKASRSAPAIAGSGKILPNPLCRCGCGFEVAKPWHVQIIGHSRGKLSRLKMQKILALIKRGDSQRSIAKKFGVSQGWICQASFGRKWQRHPAPSVVRAHEVDDYCTYQEMKKSLQKLRAKLKRKGFNVK